MSTDTKKTTQSKKTKASASPSPVKKAKAPSAPKKKTPSTSKPATHTASQTQSPSSPPSVQKPVFETPPYTPRTDTKGVVGVIGGSGFLGRYVVNHLAQAGYIVKVGSRHAPRALHLKTAAVPGRITLHATDLRSAPSVDAFVQGCDAIVNLVGLLFEHGAQNFDALHVKGVDHIVTALNTHGINRYVHISALGVDQEVKADYIHTKKQAEDHIRTQCPHAIIVRPSLIFGAEDQFFNRFARMIRLSPMIPVFKGGRTRFQPVYVDDVARGICALVEASTPSSHVYEFFGPKIYTFRELLETLMDVMHKERPIINMPDISAYALSMFSRFLPKPLLTQDQFKMLDVASVASGQHSGLIDLGITASALEDILPQYIHTTEQRGVE